MDTSKAWPPFEKCEDDDDEDQFSKERTRALNEGRRLIQEGLEISNFSPNTPINALTFANLVGCVAGIALSTSRAVRELKSKVATLEESGVKFAGVYQRANLYQRGAVVSHQGSAWVALRQVFEGEIPGQSPTAWQLLVKAGRDAS